MWLTIDIGNSAIKWGVFKDTRLVASCSVLQTGNWKSPLKATLWKFSPQRIGLSSVVPERTTQVLELVMRRSTAPILEVNHQLGFPFECLYKTPDTMGADRLSAAVGAWCFHRNEGAIIVVDAGTALTIDILHGGQFLGGTIGIGPHLESQALSFGTSKLPEVNMMVPVSPIGRSTEEAINAGILFGLVDRVNGMLNRIQIEFEEEFFVAVTGGWHEFLTRHLQQIDRVDPHLVLRGIRFLLETNPA